MVQSPSREASQSSASKEIPRILWNPKVHYRIHKCSPPLPLLNQINPGHAFPFHLLKVHFNIIVPPMRRYSKWSLHSGFPTKNLYALLLASMHVTCPPTSVFLTRCRRQYSLAITIKLLIIWSSPLPCYLVPLRPKYIPQHPILDHPHSTFLHYSERPTFTPIQNNRQNYSLIHLNLYIF